MAEGDFTIPTFPGVVGVGGGGHHDRHGLEGKDAVMIASLRNADENHRLGDSIHHSGRELLREVLENKFAHERTLREVEVKFLEKFCDLRDKVEDEGERTRNLIGKFRELDQAAEIAELKARLLALTPAPVA